ncbi:MAG: glycosyltransferase family 39 protein [Pseudomonadota bacterium]
MTASLARPAAPKSALPGRLQDVRPDTWIMAGIGLILALQFGEVFRRGINWDEFAHYNQLWEYERGNVTRAINTLYIHAFGWVKDLPGSAVDHIIVVRLFMYACELVTLCAIVGITQRFTDRTTGLLCALAYITFPFVFGHGYSFRFDPPSTALMICALWVLCVRPLDWKTIAVASLCIGTGLMVTLKIVLLIPAFAGVLWLRWSEDRFSPAFALKVALIAALSVTVAGVIFVLQTLALGEDAVANSTSTAGGVGSIMFALEAKPYWSKAAAVAVKAPLVTALIILFGYCLSISNHTRPEKVALISLFFTLTTLIYYHNTAPYYYVFLMPWVLIACSVPMRWLTARYSPIVIGALLTVCGVLTYALQSESPIDKQRTIIKAAYETFPNGVAYFDFMGMIAQYPKANGFVTKLNIKRQNAEGRSIYVEAMAKQPVPLLIRNDRQFDALFYDPANPPSLPNGVPIFTEQDAHALVDTYIGFWGPFMIAGEIIPAGERPHSFTIRVPGPYTVTGSGVSIRGRQLKGGDVIELERGDYQVAGAREGETYLLWGDRLKPPAYPAPERPHKPYW